MDLALIDLGVVVALLAALADVLGYGDGAGFGKYQMAGTAIGIAIAVVGSWMKWGPRLHLPGHKATPKTA